MDKATLRKQMLQRRQMLPSDEARRMSADIAKAAQATIDWQSISSMHVYQSSAQWNEVSTEWVEEFVRTEWPHISITIGAAVKTAPIPTRAYDLIFVPLIAFDERLHRLGFGGGWYDRFLANQPHALKIGLAYEMQRAPELLSEPHDIALSAVITEANILTK